ncbi:MAG: CDP-glycerol glycerophosphotransferase family protein, partial [Lachnospiraceae bacterium]|nr:CDP-glycerol glycerophosphotransferase family protein [Lachnospiraceae bacterium]
HEPDKKPSAFPAQSLSSERIQVLPVFEEDEYHPRAQALASLSKAQGAYTIFLDEGDHFPDTFLEGLLSQAKSSGASVVMPAQTAQCLPKSTEYFAINNAKSAALYNAQKIPTLFPTELHALLLSTEALMEAMCEISKTGKKEGSRSADSRLNAADDAAALHTFRSQENINTAVEQEKRILLYLLWKNPEFIFAGQHRIEYVLPRECDQQYDVRGLTEEWYYAPFEQFLLPLLQKEMEAKGVVPFLLQHLALYMINIRLLANMDNRNRHVIEPDGVPAYTELLSRVLAYVSTVSILDTTVHTSASSAEIKLMEIRMKKRDCSWYPELECTPDTVRFTCDHMRLAMLPKVPIRIQLIDYQNGYLEIDGSCLDFFRQKDVQIYARFGSETCYPVYNHRYSLTKYFGVSFYRMHTFHISIPVDAPQDGSPLPQKFSGSTEPAKKSLHDASSPADNAVDHSPSGERLLNFYFRPNGQGEYRMELSFPSHTSRFAGGLTYGYWRFGKYLAFHNEKGIHVLPSSPLLVLRKEVLLWKQIFKKKTGIRYIPLKMANFALRPWFSRQRIWLFMDKIYKGGDSSEYIYKYAAAQKDGIRKYYLLDPTSADYARMKKEGYRPLRRGSIWHRLIFLNANMVIASNSTVFAFNSYSTDTSQYIRGDVHSDTACVQHGMSVQKIAVAQQRLRDNTKLYFCASKYEIENLSRPAYDYKGYDALKLTGVPRYDGLKDRAQKILLISPTWRMNSALPPTKGESVARAYNPHFKETSYNHVYNSLINDPTLLAAARQYGYRIQYVLHPIISPQAEDFTKNEDVEIIPSIGDMSYEKLFCEAALMVTDFSGVQFDFAYMRKPVVYLHHHDIPQHYDEGSFYYDTMGFGEICHTNEELIQVLCEYMKNDCKMPDEYRRRADDFFEYSDNDNCARIYPIMLEHEMSRPSHPSRA